MEQTKQYKLPLKKLYFEITRKCNMSCDHCMRGEAQNKSMSKEVIDAALDNVTFVDTIFVTGGEPCLEPELIAYVIDQIVARNIGLMYFGIVTNGSILDKRIADSLNKIGRYIHEYRVGNLNGNTEMLMRLDREEEIQPPAMFVMSLDEFHNKLIADQDSFLRYYHKNCNKYVEVSIKDWKADEDAELHLERGKNKILTSTGRAKENQYIQNNYITYERRPPFRTVLGDKCVETSVYIGVNGTVGYCTNSSFEEIDITSMGSILKEPLSEILKKYAFNEPFTKDEANYRDRLLLEAKILKNGDKANKENIAIYDMLVFLTDLEYATRERLRKSYPTLTWEEITEIARHDININMKKRIGNGFLLPIMKVKEKAEQITFFESTIKQSEAFLSNFMKSHPIETALAQIYYKDEPLLGVPDKMTRERKEIHF